MMEWNGKSASVSEKMLGAYLDGELEPDERLQVEAYLATHPDAAAFVERCARLNGTMHRAFDRMLATPLPPQQAALARALDARLYGRRKSHPLRRLATVAVALFVVAGVGLLGWRGATDGGHVDQLFAVFDSGLSQPAQVSAPETTDVEPQPQLAVAVTDGERDGPRDRAGAPDFTSFGFDLISARMLARDSGQSMQLVYEARDGARVELFFSPARDNARRSLTVMEEGPVSVLFWHSGGHSYSLIGELGRDELLEMGKVVDGKWTMELPGGKLDREPQAPDDDSGARLPAERSPDDRAPARNGGDAGSEIGESRT